MTTMYTKTDDGMNAHGLENDLLQEHCVEVCRQHRLTVLG